MTRRILFVDDEPMVLRGLQRSLHTMRVEWEMVFVESGTAALDAMDQVAFDAVVSDMRMPQMNGAQLLNEIQRRHPATVRLVLSGHADRELILQCVGSAHQFLTKPCDPDLLKTAIQRALQRGGQGELDRCRELLGSATDLPVLPANYRELQKMLEDPDAPTASIAEVVAGDIGLTARVLKLTNSAFFGLRRSVSTVPEAIHFLGVDTLKALVLLQGFMDQVPKQLPRGLDLEGLTDQSLRVARIAKAIARDVAPAIADVAFGAGLLHKTGLLLLGMAQPTKVQALLGVAEEGRQPFWELEREIFGVDHAQVGAYLLALWGLPEPLVEAVRHHPCPSEAPPLPGAATVLHGACAILAGQPGFETPIWHLSWDLAHFGPLKTLVPHDRWAETYLNQERP